MLKERERESKGEQKDKEEVKQAQKEEEIQEARECRGENVIGKEKSER